MNRLQTEQQRLYAPADGGVRGAVLELARPADWAALAPAWRGVQAELELPAPAIAVSGGDALQLWFSFAAPVPAASALSFLEELRRRYLATVAPSRVRALTLEPDAARWPPAQVGPERWSAFIASDLAPLFSHEPWLDHPPGAEAQADLLSRVAAIGGDAFRAACSRLAEPAAQAPAPPDDAGGPTPLPAAARLDDPRQFLLSVMNDPQAPLALRIEAAKALLPPTR